MNALPAIDPLHTPLLPAAWDSSGRGDAFRYKDYLCTFQIAPKTTIEHLIALDKARTGKKKSTIEALWEMPKQYGYRNLYALTCFWNPEKVAVDRTTSGIAEVFTIESGQLTQPMLCLFSPDGHSNFGYSMATNASAARMELLNALTDGHPEEAERIGDIGAAYQILHGRKWFGPQSPSLSEQPKGCLGLALILLATSIGIAWKAISFAMSLQLPRKQERWWMTTGGEWSARAGNGFPESTTGFVMTPGRGARRYAGNGSENPQSKLNMLGYNVNAVSGLRASYRQFLLSLAMESKLYSRTALRDFLTTLIDLAEHRNNADMSSAVEKRSCRT